MALAPNVYDAEPIPESARAEVERLMLTGDLFRYTAPEDAPVSLLEREFAARMPDAKPSVLLDLEAGRMSEVDVINGAVPVQVDFPASAADRTLGTLEIYFAQG